MATRFVRVDLSETARDFRPIAVEPGVPMLDRSGANARIMFRWLGGMVAEPVWDGDAVGFYVRDDQGGRLEDVVVQPASSQDLATLLKDDMSKLCQRLEQSKAETSTERTLRKIVMRTFEELTKNSNRSDLDSYFFRYRDVLGNWRLIWCWGYQRQDLEPAPAVVCTNPDCNLLFLRRPGKSPRCPACAGELSLRTGNKTNWKVAGLAALALLLLLLGLGWWATRPARIVATPATYTGPVGSSTEPKIVERRLFGSRDVTRESIGISDDSRVARFDPVTGEIRVIGVGTTKLEFYRNGMKAEMVIVVTPSLNPDKLLVEPKSVDIAVGSTARLHCYGEYKDNPHVDLTNSVVWVPKNDGKTFAAGGLVEGLAPGSTTVMARFRSAAEGASLEASAAVNVAKVDFKSLEVAVDPTPITAGRGGKLRIDAVAPDGKHYSLLESSQLNTIVAPDDLAEVIGSNISGKRAGDGKLSAGLAGTTLTGQGNVKVVAPAVFPAEVRP